MLKLDGPEWQDCTNSWREPFKPQSAAAWTAFPALADLLPWVSPGVQTERAWVIAPDAATLRARWRELVRNPDLASRNTLLKTNRNRNIESRPTYLPRTGDPRTRMRPLAQEPTTAEPPPTIPYGSRAFDRQYLLADHRLMYPARPDLWAANSLRQVYIAEQHAQPIEFGPALTFSSLLPDKHFFNGRGGRVFPLYRDTEGLIPNIAPGLINYLTSVLGVTLTPEDLVAYIAAVAAHPAFTSRFREELAAPGVRVPLTASYEIYGEAVNIGREVLWLHTYGDRFADPASGRLTASPKLPVGLRPKVLVAIPGDEAGMPEEIGYESVTKTLLVGAGRIGPVAQQVWDYQTSGMRIVRHWFGYRKKNPAGRRSSALDNIRPKSWTPEMTTALLNLLNVLGCLVTLEPTQVALLDRVLAGPQVSAADLTQASVLPVNPSVRQPHRVSADGDSQQYRAF